VGTIKITPEALEANRLFNQYCYPKSPHWKNQASKQAALAMLGSGIFGDNLLKGHAKHKTTYPVNLGALIYELVNVHGGYSYLPPIAYVKEDILCEFDHHFSYIAAIVQLAGVRKDAVENYWDARREELSKAADNGKIPPDWRRLMEEKMFGGARYRPPKMGYVFADIFLSYCLLAPPSRIAGWVNTILSCLGLKSRSKSSLSDYVKQRQKEEQERITTAGEDYHKYQKQGIQIRF
jgi:hypothetical protein